MPWSRFDSNYRAPAGERDLAFVDAIREATDQAMCLDPRVFAMGLDADDKFGVFGSMRDMTHPERILGTPISENANTGVALGAALTGMRPILINLRNDFLLVAMDQIVNYVAKWQSMFDGQCAVPLVMRSVIGRGWGCGAQHSQSLQGLFAQIPGLKVVMPATPYDAKGLLLSAIKDDSPVMMFEHRWLYKNTGPVPEEMYTIPLGQGQRLHEGSSLTVVATSLAAIHTLTACEQRGLDVDLIDPRTIKPLDMDLILDSVSKTGRLLVVDYDFPFGGVAAEITSRVCEQAFDRLREPPQRIGFPEANMPASGPLERAYYPTPDTIGERIERWIGVEVCA
ncbi:MAG: alpha-ketoacid dehydrogenase subunit beta [Planctomycetes bacterium]|nr:alpha-ketoacid dehydrogenase subunit beta [Planctomycetota bacterium]